MAPIRVPNGRGKGESMTLWVTSFFASLEVYLRKEVIRHSQVIKEFTLPEALASLRPGARGVMAHFLNLPDLISTSLLELYEAGVKVMLYNEDQRSDQSTYDGIARWAKFFGRSYPADQVSVVRSEIDLCADHDQLSIAQVERLEKTLAPPSMRFLLTADKRVDGSVAELGHAAQDKWVEYVKQRMDSWYVCVCVCVCVSASLNKTLKTLDLANNNTGKQQDAPKEQAAAQPKFEWGPKKLELPRVAEMLKVDIAAAKAAAADEAAAAAVEEEEEEEATSQETITKQRRERDGDGDGFVSEKGKKLRSEQESPPEASAASVAASSVGGG